MHARIEATHFVFSGPFNNKMKKTYSFYVLNVYIVYKHEFHTELRDKIMFLRCKQTMELGVGFFAFQVRCSMDLLII